MKTSKEWNFENCERKKKIFNSKIRWSVNAQNLLIIHYIQVTIPTYYSYYNLVLCIWCANKVQITKCNNLF